MVGQNHILTKDNLLKKGWTGDPKCVFFSKVETVDHLFVRCPFAFSIWRWIALHNGFLFDVNYIQELWKMGSCITSKDDNLVEIIYGVVIWNIWLERNRIIFKDGHVKHIQLLGSKIIAVAKF